MEKIEQELKEIIRNHGYTPKLNNHTWTLPQDSKLASQSRFRHLVEHHELHKDLFLEAHEKVPQLIEKLRSEREELETIILEKNRVEPLMNELKAKDCQDYEELSVVAKYRYIAYENKKQALYKLWKLREKEKELKRLERAKKFDMSYLLQEHTERMKNFFKETLQRVF